MPRETRALIGNMSEANPLWGAPRIHGELLKLGIEISQAAVSKYMTRHRKPPSQTWRTFLENHAKDIVSVDFFTVPRATFRVLFVFVMLSNARRRVVHWNVTAAPNAAWTGQQIIDAFPWETAPRFVLRDRDGIYGPEFVRRVRGMGIEQVMISASSPWQRRTARRRGESSHRRWDRSARSRWLAGCTTGITAGSHDCEALHGSRASGWDLQEPQVLL